ncbi:MAG: TlyA family RNA methyltransferase [Desulfotignum sp.]|nr:TlyA family RNA methyltransferase [Desulfotignum sp.]MCF8124908.1 TlyA family RNA methyltransferase [Desulfotignum sp.]
MPADNRSFRCRLDQLLVDKGLVDSRTRAKAMIMAGKVRVDDHPCDKPGSRVDPGAQIFVKTPDHPYVSRGGLKLEKALTSFFLDVTDMVCLDIGASTGGFTDCLLRFKAKKVYAVDVGYGQLAWSLRNDPRVIVIERTNIRHMAWETIGRQVDLVVADTAFISLKTVIPSAERFMGDGTRVIALIKPQFEAGKQYVGKGGVVRDQKIREKVVADISQFFLDCGYDVQGVVPSPVLGPKGNTEYLISLIFNLH